MTNQHKHEHEHQGRDVPSAPPPPAPAREATPVLVEATIDWTNYATGDVHAAGDQFEMSDPALVETLYGIGFIKRVPPAEAESKHDDASRRRHR